MAPILGASIACNDLVTACTNEGPSYEVSPSTIAIEAGQVSTVSVIEVTCSGRGRTPVYPVMTVTDTTIAVVDPFHRRVIGRAMGTTALVFAPQSGGPPIIPQIPINVRLATD